MLTQEKEFYLSICEDKVSKCKDCKLCEGRTRTVFGAGNIDCDIMFIREAPGKDEDEQGKPFVGKAGQLLNQWLESCKIERKSVYIANIIKCRPPNNRIPEEIEIKSCLSYLDYQIWIIKPKVLITLGSTALKALTNDFKISIIRERGSQKSYKNKAFIPTLHPAFILRQNTKENNDNVIKDILLAKRLAQGN